MRKLLFILSIGVIMFSACTGKKRNNMVESIQQMEKNGDEYNPQYLDSLNFLYEKFVSAFPKDSLAPHYLLSSAQSTYTRGTQDEKLLDKAIQKLKELISDYNGSKETEAGIFLLANIYENNKNDTVKARKYYTMYITKYPKGEYAESVKIILEGNLGKSAEEWLEKFQKEGKIDTNTHVKTKVN